MGCPDIIQSTRVFLGDPKKIVIMPQAIEPTKTFTMDANIGHLVMDVGYNLSGTHAHLAMGRPAWSLVLVRSPNWCRRWIWSWTRHLFATGTHYVRRNSSEILFVGVPVGTCLLRLCPHFV